MEVCVGGGGGGGGCCHAKRLLNGSGRGKEFGERERERAVVR